jgi:hypothetical protein
MARIDRSTHTYIESLGEIKNVFLRFAQFLNNLFVIHLKHSSFLPLVVPAMPGQRIFALSLRSYYHLYDTAPGLIVENFL